MHHREAVPHCIASSQRTARHVGYRSNTSPFPRFVKRCLMRFSAATMEIESHETNPKHFRKHRRLQRRLAEFDLEVLRSIWDLFRRFYYRARHHPYKPLKLRSNRRCYQSQSRLLMLPSEIRFIIWHYIMASGPIALYRAQGPMNMQSELGNLNFMAVRLPRLALDENVVHWPRRYRESHQRETDARMAGMRARCNVLQPPISNGMRPWVVTYLNPGSERGWRLRSMYTPTNVVDAIVTRNDAFFTETKNLGGDIERRNP